MRGAVSTGAGVQRDCSPALQLHSLHYTGSLNLSGELIHCCGLQATSRDSGPELATFSKRTPMKYCSLESTAIAIPRIKDLISIRTVHLHQSQHKILSYGAIMPPFLSICILLVLISFWKGRFKFRNKKKFILTRMSKQMKADVTSNRWKTTLGSLFIKRLWAINNLYYLWIRLIKMKFWLVNLGMAVYDV